MLSDLSTVSSSAIYGEMKIPFINRGIEQGIPQIIKFGVVGTISAVINLFAYYVASELLYLEVNLSSISAFCISVINNYIMNHRWTFSVENEGNPVNFKQFIYYVMGNMQGLVINLSALNAVVFFTEIKFHLFGQLLGILLGMVSNFIFAKKMVFVQRNRC